MAIRPIKAYRLDGEKPSNRPHALAVRRVFLKAPYLLHLQRQIHAITPSKAILDGVFTASG